MSWFRSLKSLVSTTPTTNNEPEVSVQQKLNSEMQEKVDKLKGMWTLYVNLSSEKEKATQLAKILPFFIEIYGESSPKIISET